MVKRELVPRGNSLILQALYQSASQTPKPTKISS
jgi:hypothetical protein